MMGTMPACGKCPGEAVQGPLRTIHEEYRLQIQSHLHKSLSVALFSQPPSVGTNHCKTELAGTERVIEEI